MVSNALYATPEELRARIGGDLPTDDMLITELITAVSRLIDDFCNRHEFGFKATDTAIARLYTGYGEGFLNIDENIGVTQVAVKDAVTDADYTAWAAADWIAYRGSRRVPNYNDLPHTSIMVSSVGTKAQFLDGRYNTRSGFSVSPDSNLGRQVPTVQVTARWGYADDVPPIIREATIAQASIFYKRGRGNWSDVLRNNEFGEERFVRKLDPAIQLMLQSTRLVRRTGLT